MTRQLALVNLSNWDGEDFEIVGPVFTGTIYGSNKHIMLKPGEYVNLNVPYEGEATFVMNATESKKPVPFISEDKQKQLTPEMTVEIN